MDRQITHSEGCWRWHLPCAIATIKRLHAENQQLRDTWQLAWNALATVEKQRDEATVAVYEATSLRMSESSKCKHERDEARQWAQRLYQALKDHCGVCPRCGEVLDTITGDYEPVFRCPTCSKVYSNAEMDKPSSE